LNARELGSSAYIYGSRLAVVFICHFMAGKLRSPFLNFVPGVSRGSAHASLNGLRQR
jgi:hypothetical protein